MNGRKGFTLIELLVVIAIIAILMSILVPALQNARQQARNVLCLTHTRTLAGAWNMYCDDNKDHVPGAWNNTPIRHGAGEPWDWAWAPWRINGGNTEAHAVPCPGGSLDPACTIDERKEGIRRGSLFPYVGKEEAYHCPADQSHGRNFRSYSMPDSIGGYWGSNKLGHANANWQCLTKRSLLEFPSDYYIFVEENDPRGYNMNAWVIDPRGTSWWDPLTVWHNDGSNLAFADGHSEIHQWSKETTDYFLDVQAWAGGLTPTTPKGIEDLRYMQNGWAGTN